MDVLKSRRSVAIRLFRGRTLALGLGTIIGLGAVGLVVLGLFAWASIALFIAWKPMGKMPDGERLARIEQSEHYSDGHFVDLMPRVEPNLLKILPKWFETPHPHRRPTEPLPHVKRTRASFEKPPETGLRITWLGHSTLIVEMAGARVLIDPVWGEYVAPLELKNARRFLPPPLPLEELPHIDAVVISHDHYDHLDYPTILHLAQTEVRFYVPLGVGSHLEYWGVSPARIFEHDWWSESALTPQLTIACTPARHFSGRSGVDKDKTLWAGWALVSEKARVFYSGDTALFPEFREIGRRYGPFDATMIETGAYNQMWADVHLGPEQAVTAHQLLGGAVMIPVHWGMFDLGLHGWTEPVERTTRAAEKAGVRLLPLMPGQSVEPKNPPLPAQWWPELPFDAVDKSPVVSSGVSSLL